MSAFKPTERQKKILSLLLDKYENSLTYTGENQVHQTFWVRPEKVYPKYNDNFEAQEKVIIFEKELKELEGFDLISLTWKNNVVTKITATDENISSFYGIIGRREKKAILNDEEQFYKSVIGKNKLIDEFASDQLKRLSAGKKPTFKLAEASDIVQLLDFILKNDTELLERELSIAVLGDSKLFEKKYRTRIVKLLEKYGENDDTFFDIYDQRDQQIAILEKYGIFANPSSIWIQGDGRISFDDGKSMEFFNDRPVGLSSDSVSQIKSVQIESPDIMSVENLTSFNRLRDDKTCFIYLGGYHNRIKELFFSLISEKNTHRWYHFGDIDPDGFLILERLKRRTGIDFIPYHMGIDDLKKYSSYTKTLESNDIKKARNMIERNVHSEIMKYMLDHNEKLEQEIISIKR